MTGIGWTEFIVIALVLLLFVGPQKLPELLSKIGYVVSQLRTASRDLRNQIDVEIADLQQVKSEITDEMLAHTDKLYSEARVFDDEYKALQDEVGDVRDDIKGDFKEDFKDTLKGDIKGDMQGDIKGDIQGDIKGDVKGSIKGDSKRGTKGNVKRDTQGNVKRDTQDDIERDENGEIKDRFIAQLAASRKSREDRS